MSPEFRQIRLNADENGVTNLDLKDLEGVAQPTSPSWEEVFTSVLIPEEVNGLKILDVGAGASDAVKRLSDLGADAYAIDPRYRSRSDLKGLVRKHNKVLEGEDSARREQALESFMESIKNTPERYKTASATDIPFTNDFFDIVYSRIAVTYYLDVDRDIFSKAVSECIRVTKPGGSIRFFPYREAEPAWPEIVNDLRLNNEYEIFDKISRDPNISSLKEVDVTIRGLPWKTLVLEKV